MGDWLCFHVEIQKTIANVLNVVLDCRVHCSNRKTGIQSLKIMYDCCIMLSVKNPHCLRWGVVSLSGIHEYYEPEELVGKTAIAIVNLPPRKMMGINSEGMLISAVHEEDGHECLNLLMVDDNIPAGAKLY